MNITLTVPAGNTPAGTTIDVPDATARRLIARGNATPATKVEAKPARARKNKTAPTTDEPAPTPDQGVGGDPLGAPPLTAG